VIGKGLLLFGGEFCILFFLVAVFSDPLLHANF
jgi:hypothetical protein